MSVPLSFLKALAYSRSSARQPPTNTIGTRRANGTRRSQRLESLFVIGTASIPSLATTASGLVQMQRNSPSGDTQSASARGSRAACSRCRGSCSRNGRRSSPSEACFVDRATGGVLLRLPSHFPPGKARCCGHVKPTRPRGPYFRGAGLRRAPRVGAFVARWPPGWTNVRWPWTFGPTPAGGSASRDLSRR